MEITLRIPDDLARSLTGGDSDDLPRQALEALAIHGYRRGALSQHQVGRLLSLSRIATEDFLALHLDLYNYDPSELDREAQVLEKLSDRRG